MTDEFWQSGWEEAHRTTSVEAGRAVVARLCSNLPPARAASRWRWCAEALGDEKKRWFVVALVNHAQLLPPSLLEPMLRAAAHEHDVSVNHLFLKPCMHGAEMRAVLGVLVQLYEHGSDIEQEGVRRLVRWVGHGGLRPWKRSALDRPAGDLADLWARLPARSR